MYKFVIDSNIPFIKGRLEPFGECVYVDQFGFTPELVRDADALVIRTRTRCDASLLDGSAVRIIATATIGMDQFDLPWCAQAGIITRNAPGCNAPGVAQYVWSALLRSGFDPGRHTLGVVGCGNVGSIVAEWGRALGARVLVNDPPRAARGLTDEEYLPLEDLLRQSDALTLHVPYIRPAHDCGPNEMRTTRHLISAPQLALMKPGAILVNAARGPVIDTPAVKDAIRARGLRAIIDTWEGEPDADRELIDLAEIATFHIAGYSLEGKQRATRMALEAIGETFGFTPDLSGLANAYRPGNPPAAEKILSSYNPFADSAALKAAPEAFDRLRADYDYRPEPKNDDHAR